MEPFLVPTEVHLLFYMDLVTLYLSFQDLFIWPIQETQALWDEGSCFVHYWIPQAPQSLYKTGLNKYLLKLSTKKQVSSSALVPSKTPFLPSSPNAFGMHHWPNIS